MHSRVAMNLQKERAGVSIKVEMADIKALIAACKDSGLRIAGAVAEIDTATGPPPIVPPERRWAVEIRDAR